MSPAETPTLYVIHGSHACRSGMLMLEHKGIAYRRVDLLTGLHPLSVRMRGFPGNQIAGRTVDGRAPGPLALMDKAGTVPALNFNGEHIQTNHEIARFLDRVQPDPPLFPSDHERREDVERAERWADEDLQMASRRVALVTASHGLDAMYQRGNAGRLGPLLAPSERRRAFAARSARVIFRATPDREQVLLGALPEMFDKIDAWIDAGVIGGEQLNAADFMIVPCLALLAYRLDLRAEIEARPAGALLERVLPEPAL